MDETFQYLDNETPLKSTPAAQALEPPKWTKQAPTEPGYYWWREHLGHVASVLHVGVWPGGGLSVLAPRTSGHYTTPDRIGGEWHTPALQEPGGDAIENCQ